MRKFKTCFAAVLLGAAFISQVHAQAAKDVAKDSKAASKAAGANEVRYFTTLGDILGDLPVDAFLKEKVDPDRIDREDHRAREDLRRGPDRTERDRRALRDRRRGCGRRALDRAHRRMGRRDRECEQRRRDRHVANL